MAIHGASGVLLNRQKPLRWGCRRTSEKVRTLSQALVELMWGMEPGLAFGMICGMGTHPLKQLFKLYSVFAQAQDALVANNLEFFGSSNQWNVSFTKETHDWEVDIFASFLRVLHSVKV